MDHEPTSPPRRRRRFLPWATGVLLLAALLRLAALLDVPPGLAQDEVLDADIALFIRQGQHAFFFREGFGHEPLYHYLAAPFAPLLGDNMLAARLPSVFLGLLLVALALRWARREFGGTAAVVAGLGLAVSWWPIVFSRIGIRPILEPVLLLLMAWFWPRRPWLAGLFLGLSLYSYTGARVVFLIPLGMLLYGLATGRWRPSDPANLSRPAAVVLLTALLVSAPMFLTLRADPTLQQRVDQLAGPLQALQAGDPGPVLETTLRTLGVFGISGDPRWTYGLPDRPLFDPLTALLFLAGLLLALRRLGQPRYALLLIWLGVTLLPSAVTPQAPSTVRLIGALPPVYLLPGIAAATLIGRVPRQRRGVLALGLGGLLLLNGGRTLWNGFVTWPQATETRLNHYQATLLAIARDYAADPAPAPVVADPFYEPIDHDSLRRSLGRDLPARWVQGGGNVAGGVVVPDSGGRLYVPEYAPLDPALLAWAGVGPEPRYRGGENPGFAVYDLPPPAPAAEAYRPVAFNGGALRLEGFQLDPPAPPAPLILLTRWRAGGALPDDLAIFVHLLDETGAIVAQHDGLDAAPARLAPGDTIFQRHLLWLPADLPPGGYTLQLGLYTRRDGVRWQHDAPSGETVILTTVEISAP